MTDLRTMYETDLSPLCLQKTAMSSTLIIAY